MRPFPPLRSLRALLRAPPRGTALVEFGLGAPILVVLVIGLVDLGMGFYQALQVQWAAAAGAQYATIHGFSTSDTDSSTTCSGGSGPIDKAVLGATGLPSSNLKACAIQVCGCTDGNNFTNLGTPPSNGCASLKGVSVSGTSCTEAPGLYGLVSARFAFSPIMGYPWSSGTLTLSGQAYRRLQ